MRQAKQLELLQMTPGRCSVCSRPLTATYCHSCTKGGLGEPPATRESWLRWQADLRRTARSRLEGAGLPRAVIDVTLAATFDDRGSVPPPARLYVEPYLARLCSPRRYLRAVDVAVLGAHLHKRLVELGYDSREEADPIAAAAAETIIAQRERLREHPGTRSVHESDLVVATLAEHLGRGAGFVDEELAEYVDIMLRDHRAKRERLRVAVDVPRVRVELLPGNETDAERVAEVEAEVEEAKRAASSARARRSA